MSRDITQPVAAKTSRLRSILLNLAALAAGAVVSVLLLEFLLTLHNPFQARIKGNRIVLLTNKRYQIKNNLIPSLDATVTVTRNSLGFRGPDPPAGFAGHLTVVSIGGSTTQCFFLSDDKTWTARFGARLEQSFNKVWVNNAGLDGHSTYGHTVLLEDHVKNIHPKLVLFLIGANDIAREPGLEWDAENVKSGILFSSPTAFVKSLSAYSEVASLAANLYRSLDAYQNGLMHQRIELKKIPYLDLAPDAADRYVNSNAAFLPGFEDRVKRLVSIARSNGIEPVLITQPILPGAGAIDDLTGVDLGRIYIGTGSNGSTWWRILEMYNDVTRGVGRAQNVLVSDLAHRLPKSSLYFYDLIHFSNQGSEAIADILYRDLCPALEQKFPEYVKSPCSR